MNLAAIRIKCAELVGWKAVEYDGFWRASINGVLAHDKWISEDNVLSAGFPDYPESADAALQLVEWMSKPENGWWGFYADKYKELWAVGFESDNLATAAAITLPLAISLAFLEANGIDPETL